MSSLFAGAPRRKSSAPRRSPQAKAAPTDSSELTADPFAFSKEDEHDAMLAKRGVSASASPHPKRRLLAAAPDSGNSFVTVSPARTGRAAAVAAPWSASSAVAVATVTAAAASAAAPAAPPSAPRSAPRQHSVPIPFFLSAAAFLAPSFGSQNSTVLPIKAVGDAPSATQSSAKARRKTKYKDEQDESDEADELDVDDPKHDRSWGSRHKKRKSRGTSRGSGSTVADSAASAEKTGNIKCKTSTRRKLDVPDDLADFVVADDVDCREDQAGLSAAQVLAEYIDEVDESRLGLDGKSVQDGVAELAAELERATEEKRAKAREKKAAAEAAKASQVHAAATELAKTMASTLTVNFANQMAQQMAQQMAEQMAQQMAQRMAGEMAEQMAAEIVERKLKEAADAAATGSARKQRGQMQQRQQTQYASAASPPASVSPPVHHPRARSFLAPAAVPFMPQLHAPVLHDPYQRTAPQIPQQQQQQYQEHDEQYTEEGNEQKDEYDDDEQQQREYTEETYESHAQQPDEEEEFAQEQLPAASSAYAHRASAPHAGWRQQRY